MRFRALSLVPGVDQLVSASELFKHSIDIEHDLVAQPLDAGSSSRARARLRTPDSGLAFVRPRILTFTCVGLPRAIYAQRATNQLLLLIIKF